MADADRARSTPAPVRRFAPSAGTRAIVLWHFGVWILEIAAQVGSLFLFMIRRRRVRNEMHALILRRSAEHGGGAAAPEVRPEARNRASERQGFDAR